MPTWIRPILVFIIGLAIDNAIARGVLTPAEKQVWVDGALTVIGATGTVLLTIISLWHEYVAMHKANAKAEAPTPTLVGNVLRAVFGFMFKPQMQKAVENAVQAAEAQSVEPVTPAQ